MRDCVEAKGCHSGHASMRYPQGGVRGVHRAVREEEEDGPAEGRGEGGDKGEEGGPGHRPGGDAIPLLAAGALRAEVPLYTTGGGGVSGGWETPRKHGPVRRQ